MNRESLQTVAVVLSNHDALPEPCAPDATPSEAQLDAMLRAVLELAGPPAGRGDRVLIKPNIVCCPGLSPAWGPGAVTDLRIVRSLVRWLMEAGCAGITIAEGAGGWRPAPLDGWTTDWGGEFGGLTYAGIAREFGAALLDLNTAPTVSYRAAGRSYALARAVRDCDRLVTLSPLKTNKGTGASLAMKNLFGIAPGSVYGFPKFGLHAVGPLAEIVADIWTFRPDAYGILGGSWAVEGEADTALRHNVLVAGPNCVAVDSVAAAVMGFEPGELEFLNAARRRGLGTTELRSILVRGNSIQQARRAFLRPAQWEVACK